MASLISRTNSNVTVLQNALTRMGIVPPKDTDPGALRAACRDAFGKYYGRTYTVGPAKGSKHTASVVFCHGLGDTGQGWAQLMQGISPIVPGVKFILPTAPTVHVTVNGGIEMPAWYDITLPDGKGADDTAGMQHSAVYVRELLEAERLCGVPTVVAGFSQGAALALFTALTQDPSAPLAGAIVLSGYLHSKSVMGGLSDVGKTLPILMCHGEADEVVRIRRAEDAIKEVQKMGRVESIVFKRYRGMGHSSSPEEERAFVYFLQEIIPTQ